MRVAKENFKEHKRHKIGSNPTDETQEFAKAQGKTVKSAKVIESQRNKIESLSNRMQLTKGKRHGRLTDGLKISICKGTGTSPYKARCCVITTAELLRQGWSVRI